MRRGFANLYCFMPWIVSIAVSAELGSALFQNGVAAAISVFAALFGFVTLFILLSALMSLPFQSAIRPLKCRREISDNDYFPRFVYGRLWSSLFYFKTLYALILNIAGVRNVVFRLFGYRGSNQFTIFPDAWVRDLPLLKFSDGVYVANRATLGTNICLRDNTAVVGAITMGPRTLLGHLGVIALGSTIGADSEVGVSGIIGIRCRVGERTIVAGRAAVNHGCRIGNQCNIGVNCYIGIRAVLHDDIVVPPGTTIPDGKIVRNQTEMNEFLTIEKDKLDRIWTDIEQIQSRFIRAR